MFLCLNQYISLGTQDKAVSAQGRILYIITDEAIKKKSKNNNVTVYKL
jgi:hypothetical protein